VGYPSFFGFPENHEVAVEDAERIIALQFLEGNVKA